MTPVSMLINQAHLYRQWPVNYLFCMKVHCSLWNDFVLLVRICIFRGTLMIMWIIGNLMRLLCTTVTFWPPPVRETLSPCMWIIYFNYAHGVLTAISSDQLFHGWCLYIWNSRILWGHFSYSNHWLIRICLQHQLNSLFPADENNCRNAFLF